MLWPGPACTINGFVGQLSVQAADFSILVIAVVTLLTITRTTYMPAASTLRKCLICGSVWITPLTTATIATAMGKMGPVSGNWCWILKESTGLRYALTHGWRIAIIFCTAAIYIFVWWYMDRHFRSLVSTMSAGKTTVASKESWYQRRRGFKKMGHGAGAAQPGHRAQRDEETELSTMSKSRISRVGGVEDWGISAPEAAYVRSSTELFDTRREGADKKDDNDTKVKGKRSRTTSFHDASLSDDDDYYNDEEEEQARRRNQYQQQTPCYDNKPVPFGGVIEPAGAKSPFDFLRTNETAASEFPHRRQTRKVEREIKRMLLLNAYPIMYVILWIPGLINRFMEATGRTPSDGRALAAMQASSQFVGLANALTYGFNTALRARVKRWWRERKANGERAVSRASARAAAARGKREGGGPEP